MRGREVYVVDAVRTPVGRFGGALAKVRSDDLAVARMAALLAGLPVSVPGATTNRLCASGLDAVIGAARAIAVGDASIVVAGGVESMTRAPYVLPKSDRAFPAGNAELFSTTLGWRMVNPALPAEWTVSLGEATEQLAEEFAVDRAQADVFAARSHQLAASAWRAGAYDAAVVQVAGAPLERDESIRDGVTADSLGALRPVFRANGQVTAGNASPLSDGAAALLLADEDGLRELGAEPLARIGATGVHAVEPHRFGIAPVEAVDRALAKAGRRHSDVTVLELNEAFAARPGAGPDPGTLGDNA